MPVCVTYKPYHNKSEIQWQTNNKTTECLRPRPKPHFSVLRSTSRPQSRDHIPGPRNRLYIIWESHLIRIAECVEHIPLLLMLQLIVLRYCFRLVQWSRLLFFSSLQSWLCCLKSWWNLTSQTSQSWVCPVKCTLDSALPHKTCHVYELHCKNGFTSNQSCLHSQPLTHF